MSVNYFHLCQQCNKLYVEATIPFLLCIQFKLSLVPRIPDIGQIHLQNDASGLTLILLTPCGYLSRLCLHPSAQELTRFLHRELPELHIWCQSHAGSSSWSEQSYSCHCLYQQSGIEVIIAMFSFHAGSLLDGSALSLQLRSSFARFYSSGVGVESL